MFGFDSDDYFGLMFVFLGATAASAFPEWFQNPIVPLVSGAFFAILALNARYRELQQKKASKEK